MLQFWIAMLVGLCVCSPAWGTGDERLPLPAELEPNFRFWLRIYTEVDGQGGLVHDSENMGVVYEVTRFPQGLGHRSRQRHTEKIKKRYRSILHRLGKGKRSGLSEEEARVLARWPEGVSNKTLARAATQVRFQTGQADRFREGLVRSGRWRQHVEERLAAHGVPRELAALPHVESSFNPSAYSRVGAAGLWQFTRSTGRLYLRVDHVVDERMDPWAATDGAARLLRDNYRRLGSWPLAITAYNHGPAGIARAVKTVGTDDIGVIARKYKGRTFGFASRNFYSEFLAALEIDGNRERYFGYVQPDPPTRYEILETDAFYSAATLGRVLKIRPEVLREHNLALRASVWNGAKLVPKDYALRIPASEVAAPLSIAMANIPESERMTRQHRDRFHKVRRGESLSVIASRYHTTMSELVALNNLRSRHRIRAGQVLRLPDDGMPPTVVGRRTPPSDGLYRVERGDSLWVISQRFGVSQKDLVQWNSLRNRNQLSVGQALRVEQAPAATPKVIAAASSTATDGALTAPTREIEPEAPALIVADRAEAPTARGGSTTRAAEASPRAAEASPQAAVPSPQAAVRRLPCRVCPRPRPSPSFPNPS
jgi:membrane-bound lytic murein transglycosylase D